MTAQANAPSVDRETEVQRAYYKQNARDYDARHIHADNDEHRFAIRILEAIVDCYGIRSILDIGAGTGRVARHFKTRHPGVRVVSVEPVRELREIGYANGLTQQELVDGDANNLAFKEGEFDLVCEFAVLHHVRNPGRAVQEMMRVAKVGIFISDSNNFGQGSLLARIAKQSLNALGLWKVADLVKTRGKGYSISAGDGLAYSYSVFNNYDQIARQCNTFIFNTHPAGMNPYRSASDIALFGLKK
jgi:ubiquinone/menaquinone biosynthesis C-methylase UbiE